MTLQLQNRIAGLERKILPHIEAKLKMRCAVWCERKMENQNSALEIIKLHMVNWEKIVNQSQDSSTWKVFRRNHKKARALTRAFWDIRISSLGFGGCPSALLFLFIKTSTLQTFLFHTTKHHNLQNAFTKTKSNHWSSRSLLLYYAINHIEPETADIMAPVSTIPLPLHLPSIQMILSIPALDETAANRLTGNWNRSRNYLLVCRHL